MKSTLTSFPEATQGGADVLDVETSFSASQCWIDRPPFGFRVYPRTLKSDAFRSGGGASGGDQRGHSCRQQPAPQPLHPSCRSAHSSQRMFLGHCPWDPFTPPSASPIRVESVDCGCKSAWRQYHPALFLQPEWLIAGAVLVLATGSKVLPPFLRPALPGPIVEVRSILLVAFTCRNILSFVVASKLPPRDLHRALPGPCH